MVATLTSGHTFEEVDARYNFSWRCRANMAELEKYFVLQWFRLRGFSITHDEIAKLNRRQLILICNHCRINDKTINFFSRKINMVEAILRHRLLERHLPPSIKISVIMWLRIVFQQCEMNRLSSRKLNRIV